MITNIVIVYLIGCVIGYLIVKYTKVGAKVVDDVENEYNHMFNRWVVELCCYMTSWFIVLLLIVHWYYKVKAWIYKRRMRKVAKSIEAMAIGKDEKTAKDLQKIADMMRDAMK